MSGLVIRKTTHQHHCGEMPYDAESGSVWLCDVCSKQWINSRLFGGWRKKIFRISIPQSDQD